ncbi:3-hydroxybutyrate dehydrogenase [Marinobacterium sp. AK62]|uniref:3-hydroxybutyrate dehydrogenase n=1 Tax=Marinobacterium alkalitolerans TaxID=1542925 RepID=A0ABS3Z7A3_9GAMM|nr:3-hydroxybutyrate dehydrogenase [Marinobacterium alkalitolerans]MBP0047585.1 3-hydroxybutyrate dehydrogenase [Marinobacterium alkalitolerans]
MNIRKLALVTGSTSGIGLEVARVLAANGLEVVLHGLEPDATGAQLADEFEQAYGRRPLYCQADLSQPQEIDRLMQTVTEQVGSPTILVNNAGIQHTAPAEQFPPAMWDKVIAINLSAAFHTSRLALPGMQAQGWGRIINISSVHGLVASVNKSAYCAAKHGLVGFTRVMALENAARGITANCICPGWVDTPLLVEQFKAYAQEHDTSFEAAKQGLISAKTPYPDFVAPSEIGAMTLFLCSDAARAINGTALPIDGGWTAQ